MTNKMLKVTNYFWSCLNLDCEQKLDTLICLHLCLNSPTNPKQKSDQGRVHISFFKWNSLGVGQKDGFLLTLPYNFRHTLINGVSKV